MSKTYDFTNKVAFITGGSSGIGKSTALLFAQNGAKVVIADVNEDAGGQLAATIRKQGGQAEFVFCNVAEEKDIQKAIHQTVRTFGGLDIAFNNAGIEGLQGFTKDCTTENWNNVIAINLTGVWLCMKYQIPEILKRGGGAIVNCSSIAGVIGFPGIPAYVASKHGVIGLTKTAALEHAKQNLRINAICPGVIQTPMIDRFTHGEARARQQLLAGEPIGRVGSPEEVAHAAAWLCSSASSFVTGHSMVIDGGWVAQ